MKTTTRGRVLPYVVLLSLVVVLLAWRSLNSPLDGRFIVAVTAKNYVTNGSDFIPTSHNLVGIFSHDVFWKTYASPKMLALGLSPGKVRAGLRITAAPKYESDRRTVTLHVRLNVGGNPAFQALRDSFSEYCDKTTLYRKNDANAVLQALQKAMESESNSERRANLQARLSEVQSSLSSSEIKESHLFPHLQSADIVASNHNWF